MSEEILKILDKLNASYVANGALGLIDQKEVFKFIDRNSKLIICAPHATKTCFNETDHKIDLFTGALTEFIGQDAGVSTIVRRKYLPYRSSIWDFIELNQLGEHCFLDMHGMKMNDGFDLAIGTGYFDAMKYRQAIENINELAKKYEINVYINHPDYRGAPGLTGHLQKKYQKCNVLQLEWAPNFRDYYNYPDNVLGKTIPFMKAIIENHNNILGVDNG